jgi:hypothetical protein
LLLADPDGVAEPIDADGQLAVFERADEGGVVLEGAMAHGGDVVAAALGLGCQGMQQPGGPGEGVSAHLVPVGVIPVGRNGRVQRRDALRYGHRLLGDPDGEVLVQVDLAGG